MGAGFVALVTGLTVVADAAPQGKGQEKHPYIRRALHELREAKKELQEAARDFGGYRAEAARNTDVSIFLLEKTLQFDKGGKGKAQGKKKLIASNALAPASFQIRQGERHPH